MREPRPKPDPDAIDGYCAICGDKFLVPGFVANFIHACNLKLKSRNQEQIAPTELLCPGCQGNPAQVARYRRQQWGKR
jgi:hypothetical protein